MDRFYLSLDELVIAFNIFVFFQKYAIVKKYTLETNKKKILQKVILIFNRSKKLIDTAKGKQDTTSQKRYHFLNAITILE